MKRTLRFASVFGIIALVATLQAWADDKVTYYDHAQKKVADVSGTISKEGPSGVEIGAKKIPATDIVDVVYDGLKGAKLDYNAAVAKERTASAATTKEADRQKASEAAASGYKDALKVANGAAVKRHIQYRIAALLAKQAEDDTAKMDDAIKALKDFKDKHNDGWQIIPAVKALARLQMKNKQGDEALKTYKELAAMPNVSKEIQQEADLMIVEALMQDKSTFGEAEKKLHELVKSLPADDPQRAKAQVFLARCLAGQGKDKLAQAVTDLEKAIDQAKDADLKAVAYNALGDCYLMNGQPAEARWAYLWVDMIYNQNKEQHAKALNQLGIVFTELKDEKHAKEYLEKAKQAK